MKLSNKIMVSSWMGDPMVCIFQLDYFFQVKFSCKSILFVFLEKLPPGKKIPGGKICIFRLILLLYIAFRLYSISCEGEKNPPVFFLRFHVLKYTWIPAGPFRTGLCMQVTFHDICHSHADIFQHYFFQNILSGITLVSNSLDPELARHCVGPYLGPNCL